jgi:hypothetical protein
MDPLQIVTSYTNISATLAKCLRNAKLLLETRATRCYVLASHAPIKSKPQYNLHTANTLCNRVLRYKGYSPAKYTAVISSLRARALTLHPHKHHRSNEAIISERETKTAAEAQLPSLACIPFAGRDEN